MIVYFTGTGNSRYAAQYLAGALGDEMTDSFDYIRGGSSTVLSSEKPWVFVCPTYAWRIPRVFDAFISRCGFRGSRRAYFFLTCGSSMGEAGSFLRRRCRDWGLEFCGAAEIVMPENYLAMFPVPGEAEAETIRRRALESLQRAAEAIRGGEILSGRSTGPVDWIESHIVNPCFYPLIVHAKKFRAGEKCIGCGECVRRCPLNNIRLSGGRPVWGSECTHCMACICYCPTEAIEYGRASLGKPRYRCPDYRE